jgi:hypothetical protein
MIVADRADPVPIENTISVFDLVNSESPKQHDEPRCGSLQNWIAHHRAFRRYAQRFGDFLVDRLEEEGIQGGRRLAA